jgi:hypothetical protein
MVRDESLKAVTLGLPYEHPEGLGRLAVADVCRVRRLTGFVAVRDLERRR